MIEFTDAKTIAAVGVFIVIPICVTICWCCTHIDFGDKPDDKDPK